MPDFAKALPFVLAREGGYVNDPADPGGATNKGITQHTYTAWLLPGPSKDVRHITDSEVAAIYKARYWDEVVLPTHSQAMALLLFDSAVQFGPFQAREWLSMTSDPATYLLIREAIYRWQTRKLASPLRKFRQGWLNRIALLRQAVSVKPL